MLHKFIEFFFAAMRIEYKSCNTCVLIFKVIIPLNISAQLFCFFFDSFAAACPAMNSEILFNVNKYRS